MRGIEAGRERARRLDELVGELRVDGGIALVAIGGYGARELTPQAEAEVLVLHRGGLATREVTATIAYPLWSRGVRVEASARTLEECASGRRRSVTFALGILEARLVAGDAALFEDLAQRVLQPLRRDRDALRNRARTHVEHRHASHPAASSAATPDVVDGRGGLRDIQLLRLLEAGEDEHLAVALDFFLSAIWALEEHAGHAVHRLTPRYQEWLASTAGHASANALVGEVYRHARWVAFRLDGVWALAAADRTLASGPLELRGGRLVGHRLPHAHQAPALALRVANLVGLAPPALPLLEWAAGPGPEQPEPVTTWDDAAREQLWLLLRAADWRAWDFLEATDLLARLLPEWVGVAMRPGASGALDTHSFASLRRLHEWAESDDVLARRVWRRVRHRDWLYLAALLHECSSQAAEAAAERIGLPAEAQATIAFLVDTWRLLDDTAARRDLHDEELLLDLVARIRTSPRLCMLFALSVAHAHADGERASNTWSATQVRRLFLLLERMLRSSPQPDQPRRRSVELHRERLAALLHARGLDRLQAMVARLPRRYVLARSPAFILRHLELATRTPLAEGELRMRAQRHRHTDAWDILVVARDRPGLLSTVAGVLALRGASVLTADAATCSDGLVLDVFTVTSAYGAPLEASLWPHVAADLRTAMVGHLPLEDLLAVPASLPEPASVSVAVDNTASEVFSVVEVRAPDQVGLLYRIARGLRDLGLDIHHAKIATHPSGVQDAFYVWDLAGEKLNDERSAAVSRALAARLTAGEAC